MALAIVLASAHTRLAGQTGGTVATVGLTAGWATFGEALPQGQATGALQIGSLPTQTDVKNRWPDGSIRFAASANVQCRQLPSGGRRRRIVRSRRSRRVGHADDGGVAYVANRRPCRGRACVAGPLVQSGAPSSPARRATPHPFLRVIFDTRVYRRQAHVSHGRERAQSDRRDDDDLRRRGGNGQTLFARQRQHYYLTRWRKARHSTRRPRRSPGHRPFNLARAIPPFNAVVALDPRVDVISANFDILQSGAVYPIWAPTATAPKLRSRFGLDRALPGEGVTQGGS